MPGSAVRVTERAPSLRISLRKRTVTQIPEAPTPTPAKTPRSQPKKRGRPSASKSKSQSTARSTVDGRTRAGRGRSSGKYKHTRPWEVDDGDDRAYDYVSCSESESSSSEEEEYSLRSSQAHVFLEDEQDTDCIANDDSFQYSEEDAAECSRIPWIDLPSTEIPPLVLPESSKDIPVPCEYLLDVVE
ncbi:hypothetical protein GCK32_017735, partial [Trichostrongylus colubriformis]